MPTTNAKPFLRPLFLAACLLAGAEGLRAQDAGPILRSPDPIGDYMAAIDEAEGFDSAYSVQLADLYLGLGGELVRAGKIEEARDAYFSGAQIVRVNFGPDAPEQVNYLLALAELDLIETNWEDADDLMHSAFRIFARGDGSGADGQLASLQQLLDWYRDRYPDMPPTEQFRALLRSEQITREMAGIEEGNSGLQTTQTAALYRQVGHLNYRVAEYLAQLLYAQNRSGTTSMTLPEVARWDGQRGAINPPYDMGVEAYRKAAESVAANPQATPQQKAEALAQLADWHLTFGKVGDARRTYGEAWQLLASTAELEDAQFYFGTPTPVRFLNQTPLKPGTQEAMPKEGLDVTMTVTKTGSVLNVRVANSADELPNSQVRAIKSALKRLRFRPRVDQGQTAETREFLWRVAVESPAETT
ncbi:MAG: hypothetical protein AAGH19_04150 [Pseudomonadota bacterium]